MWNQPPIHLPTNYRNETASLIKAAVGEQKLEYMRVIGPSSMNRGQDEAVWKGAEYQLSFAFKLLPMLKLKEEHLYYQEMKADGFEAEMLRNRGVNVLEARHWKLSDIPEPLRKITNEPRNTRIVLFVPAGGLFMPLCSHSSQHPPPSISHIQPSF